MTTERRNTSPTHAMRLHWGPPALGLALLAGCSGGGGASSEPQPAPVPALASAASQAVSSDRYSGAIDHGAGLGGATGTASNETTTVQWGTQQ